MIPLHAPEWLEGWALDNYLESDLKTFTPLAHLIRSHKYGPYDNAEALAYNLDTFINAMWPTRPFDAVVPVAGRLSNKVAEYLKMPVSYLTKIDDSTVKFTPHENRVKSLNNFQSSELKAEKGILVIDDIFDSGFSMRGACRALSKYNLPIYVVALTINNLTNETAGTSVPAAPTVTD